MNNDLLQIKIKQRLNKLAAFDYDNIECWQILEAFNKVQLQWAAREAEMGESSKQSIERMQGLLKQIPLAGSNQKLLYQSIEIPDDYLSFKRISFYGSKEGCKHPRKFKTYLVEEANIDELLRDPLRRPDFDWGEALATMMGNKIKIHTSAQFIVNDPVLVYYRKPALLRIIGCVDPSTGLLAETEQACEFKEDVVEFLVSETAAQLAADLESINQVQINASSAQRSE
ncbi:MAG TPA: hypothetical protein VGM30_10605 [Puia sp.]|jgi:hypothetical protein